MGDFAQDFPSNRGSSCKTCLLENVQEPGGVGRLKHNLEWSYAMSLNPRYGFLPAIISHTWKIGVK